MAIPVRFIAVQAGSPGPGALTMLSAEALLSRLPASAQKEIRWSQPALKEALRPLFSEPLSDELLNGVAEHLQQPFETVMRAYLPSFLRERSIWLDALRAENLKERTLLQRVTADADTIDTTDWIYGYLGLLLEFSVAPVISGETSGAVSGMVLLRLRVDLPPPGPRERFSLCLMRRMQPSRRQETRERRS